MIRSACAKNGGINSPVARVIGLGGRTRAVVGAPGVHASRQDEGRAATGHGAGKGAQSRRRRGRI